MSPQAAGQEPVRLGKGPSALVELVHQALGAAPDAPALLHKQRGLWRLYQGRSVLPEIDRLAGTLASTGVDADARLVLSGVFAPEFLFTVLAAAQLGAALQTIPRHVFGDDLSAALIQQAPSHAFVQGRRTITRWLAVEPPSGSAITLLTDVPAMPHSSAWRTVPLGQPSSVVRHPRPAAVLGRILDDRQVVWVDEGTEWHGGLDAVLTAWLRGRAVLAFPESPESSARDRREIRINRLLVSPERQRQLDAERARRLPPPGSLLGRLGALAAADNPGLLARVIGQRIDRVIGLPSRA